MTPRSTSNPQSDDARESRAPARRKRAKRATPRPPNPAIVERTADVAAYIEEHGGAAAFASRGIATNPRATAVATLFAAKLLGKADDIPLDDLVTTQSLAPFQALLGDETRLAELRASLGGMGLVWPRVQPQPDGSVVVLLVRRNAQGGGDTAESSAPERRPSVGLRVRLTEEPDDWRVEWSA
jgi:hypothetical protein